MNEYDKDKDESYIRRRDLLLQMMKRQQWDDEPKQPSKKKGPKPKQQIPKTNNQNKFFKF
jgi:hypothetical protein